MSDEVRTGRPMLPFSTTRAAHAVAQAAESLGWDFSDPDAFLKRIQHVEYGLSAEIEFAAILRWLGLCKFVHRLNDDALTDPQFGELEVPDLFAVFTHGEERRSVLIEVKTTEGMSLHFTKPYIERLRAYAALLSQPLLIAWRPRNIGFWILLDADLVVAGDEGCTVRFDDAIKNDLMCLLAGDYSIIPMQGAGLRFVADRIGEKEPTEDGFQAVFQITEATFHDATGNRMSDVSNELSALILSTLTHDEEVTDDRMVKSFTTHGGLTRAQLVLRTAITFSMDEGERIHWKAVSASLGSIIKAADLLAEAQGAFGTCVEYVIYQQPQVLPAFLVTGWTGPFGVRHRVPADDTGERGA
jgi:hypothetical protein